MNGVRHRKNFRAFAGRLWRRVTEREPPEGGGTAGSMPFLTVATLPASTPAFRSPAAHCYDERKRDEERTERRAAPERMGDPRGQGVAEGPPARSPRAHRRQLDRGVPRRSLRGDGAARHPLPAARVALVRL